MPEEKERPMTLKGKTAIVTGAARGIGRAIALALSRQGCRVVLADIHPPIQTAELVRKEGGDCLEAAVDVSDYSAVQKAVEEAVAEFDRIDILVNNAGIIHRGTFLDLKPEDWRSVLDVNLGGTFNCCHAVVPLMISKGGGRIINITSIAGKIGDITASPAYGTSKGAINTFTKSLARQLASYNITVNAIAPHAIETDMSAQWSDEKRREVINSIPLKRLGKPEEVAEAVLFLVSEGASFITGEILDMNGGYLMD